MHRSYCAYRTLPRPIGQIVTVAPVLGQVLDQLQQVVALRPSDGDARQELAVVERQQSLREE